MLHNQNLSTCAVGFAGHTNMLWVRSKQKGGHTGPPLRASPKRLDRRGRPVCLPCCPHFHTLANG